MSINTPIDINPNYELNNDVESYLKVYTWPMYEELLTKPCKNVVTINDKLLTFVELMKTTIKKHNAVGLAAPQVGVNLRVAVIYLDEPKVIINPTIIYEEGEQVVEEGCLSVPGVYKSKTFPQKIHIHNLTLNGKEEVLTFEGVHAVVLKHELNHLDGNLMVTDWNDEEKKQAAEAVNSIVLSHPELYQPEDQKENM